MKSTIKFNFLLIITVFFSTFTLASPPSSVPTIVYAILSYAIWQKANPTICIVNNQELTNKFNNTPTTSTNNYKIANIATTELRNTACNAIVFSNLSPKEEQYLLNNVINFPALTISTNNFNCEEGSAFCIYKRNQQLSFKVNLESVHQS